MIREPENLAEAYETSVAEGLEIQTRRWGSPLRAATVDEISTLRAELDARHGLSWGSAEPPPDASWTRLRLGWTAQNIPG